METNISLITNTTTQILRLPGRTPLMLSTTLMRYNIKTCSEIWTKAYPRANSRSCRILKSKSLLMDRCSIMIIYQSKSSFQRKSSASSTSPEITMNSNRVWRYSAKVTDINHPLLPLLKRSKNPLERRAQLKRVAVKTKPPGQISIDIKIMKMQF